MCFRLRKTPYFPSFSLVSYVKRITIVSWGGGQKVWCFSVFSRQRPHPTCTRCRGRVCTRDLTGDICAEWSSSQWELFAKKRSYAERKRHSRPSGSVSPAPKTSPLARTSSEVKHSEASSSSSSLPSGGQVKREGGGGGGGSRDAPGAASREASSPARPKSSERGGGVSGRSSGACFCLLGSFGSWGGGSCSFAADAPCPRCFLGCLSSLITACSATW